MGRHYIKFGNLFGAIFLLNLFVLDCKHSSNSSLLPLLPSVEMGAPCLPDRDPPCLKLTEIANGFNASLLVTAPPGDTTRLFVVEQGGKIKLIKNGTLLPTPFLNLGTSGSDLIAFSGERGLLGLAFHPNYSTSGRFWVNYTRKSDGATVVAEYIRSAGDADIATPTAVKIVFTVDQPFANHNGGMLAFAPDGTLFIGMGDGGSIGDPQNNAQNLESALGKMLRIDVDTYPTPVAGNRTVSGAENPHVWDWGFRNPWRYSFDRSNGDLYIADVGQNAYEEINIETSGQGLKNYGWRITEGKHCYNPLLGCDFSGITLPVLDYNHSTGTSITGGYVYRGSAIPSIVGRYFFADFIHKRIWSFLWSGGTVQNLLEHTIEMELDSNISSFGEDANGEIYVVDYGGRIFRIDIQ